MQNLMGKYNADNGITGGKAALNKDYIICLLAYLLIPKWNQTKRIGILLCVGHWFLVLISWFSCCQRCFRLGGEGVVGE